EDLPISIRSENSIARPTSASSAHIIPIPIGATMKEAEKMIIESVLEHCEGSRKETAKMLSISERSLRNKLQIYREENT
ncbi:MAG TPA: helix-turn-helix domain-containing protein, partial [Pseudobacillus sp.]